MKPLLEFLTEKLEKHKRVAVGETHNEPEMHNLVADLTLQLSLDAVCLEMPSLNQQNIDRYLATGDEKYLQKVILDQLRLVDVGYPFEERIPSNSRYFDIIRNAQKKGVGVKMIQANIPIADVINRESDLFMSKQIPEEGKVLIYAGNMHIRKDAIPKFRPNIYSIKTTRDNPKALQIPFAFDFKDEQRLLKHYQDFYDGVLVY